MESCFLSTQEPGLIAKYKRVRELGDPNRTHGDAAAAILTALRDRLPTTDRTVSTPEQLAETAMLGRIGKSV